MKRLLLSYLIILNLIFSLNSAWADTSTTPTTGITDQERSRESGYDGFDVRNIFSVSSSKKGQPSENLTSTLIQEGEQSGSIVEAIILRAINILMLFLGTVAMILLMAGGLTWITAGGEEGKIDRGKAIITQTVTGMIVAIMSYAIVSFVISFFF